MFRRIPVLILLGIVALTVACTNKKVKNPIANIDSKQPDKVLFDRAMDALKHNRFDVARLTLQTLINTYPDSEFIARAKLGVADSWYAEGGSAGLAQAEIEYADFKTFFPNMAEAAEAQLKIANIHYQQMEKPDRDFTHAMRAEQEYRALIMQYPESKLVPEAKQRLLEVQEVLAEREFGIGRFYYLRPSYPAAIARLRSLVDRYPLYSKADEALFLLGQSYENQMAFMQRQNFEQGSVAWKARKNLVDDYTIRASDAYKKILIRYPAMPWAPDAKERLEALHQEVPKPTKAAYAQNKQEVESRKENGTLASFMGSFRKHPDVSGASHVGDPTLVSPEPTSASDVVRQATRAMSSGMGSTGGGGGGTVAVEIGKGAPPIGDGTVPRSDGTAPNPSPASIAPAPDANELLPNANSNAVAAAPDPNELKPNVSAEVPQAPAQTNQIDLSNPQASVAAAADANEEQDVNYSSSKHKKKKGLRKVVPF